MGWIRGPTIGTGSSATVTLAIFDDVTLAAAKSAPLSRAAILQHEESVLVNDLHPCRQIVTCFGHEVTTDPDGEQYYNLFLEYVPDGSLADLLRDSRSPLAELAVRLFAKSILKGVSFIHSKGYVHCDIKPDNILVVGGGGGDVKIADFGLAKRRREEIRGCFMRGTPMYMSPEAVGKGEFEAAMDVWGVGCVVAEMAGGGAEWRRGLRRGWDGMWKLMRMRINGYCEEEEEMLIPSGLSEEGKNFLRRCFDRDPGTRWTAEMLLGHPFVAGLDGDIEYCRRLTSPQSVLSFSNSLSSLPSSCSSSTTTTRCGGVLGELLGGAKERLGRLATGDKSDWSDQGWIFVRGINVSD